MGQYKQKVMVVANSISTHRNASESRQCRRLSLSRVGLSTLLVHVLNYSLCIKVIHKEKLVIIV